MVRWSLPIDPASIGTGAGMTIIIGGQVWSLNTPVADGLNGVRWSLGGPTGGTPDPPVVRYVAPVPPFGDPISSVGGDPSPSFTLAYSIV